MNTVGIFNVLRLSAERMVADPAGAADIESGGERGVIINTARCERVK